MFREAGQEEIDHGPSRDHRENDFPGYDHHDWDVKRELASHAREVARGTPTQVIAVYTGLFIELSLNVRTAPCGPCSTWHTDTQYSHSVSTHAQEPLAEEQRLIGVHSTVGFDIDNNVLTCFGPPTQIISFTSTADVGRALARLSTLALEPLTATQVPDELRISGSAVSYEEVRDLIAEAKGVQKGEIKSEDLEKLKHKLRDTPGSHVVEYIRCVARSVCGAVR